MKPIYVHYGYSISVADLTILKVLVMYSLNVKQLTKVCYENVFVKTWLDVRQQLNFAAQNAYITLGIVVIGYDIWWNLTLHHLMEDEKWCIEMVQ